MLSVEEVNHYYGESHTLWDLSFEVSTGARTCLMGRNGVGKTTLLKCIMGLEPAASGYITLDDEELCREPAEFRARHGIAYVPQGREIFPRLYLICQSGRKHTSLYNNAGRLTRRYP